jgi:hypothetical protein
VRKKKHGDILNIADDKRKLRLLSPTRYPGGMQGVALEFPPFLLKSLPQRKLGEGTKGGLIPILVCILIMAAQPVAAQPPDIYAALDTLWNRLVQWQQLPPQTTPVDTLDLNELFADYQLNIDTLPNGERIISARLPAYLGVLTTQLNYQITAAGDSVNYIPNLSIADQIITYDDAIKISIPINISISDSLIATLNDRLHLYRTFALPPPFSPANPALPSPLRTIFHGKQLDSLEYPDPAVWLATMQRLAEGTTVYAGLLAVTPDSAGATAEYYIALTSADARGHHFFKIAERIPSGDAAGGLLRVEFIPFVRTDNLRALFASPEENHEGTKIPVKVRK